MDQVSKLEKMIAAGNFSEALDFIEAMRQEDRQQWQIQNLTGIVCSYCGQFAEAETFFKAALEQEPNDPEILYNLADAYVSLGKDRLARAALERCAQQDGAGHMAGDIRLLYDRLNDQKGGRVLMAAYYFPPLSGSGVFRSLKFAKYLPQFGWQPTVISTDRPPNVWKFEDESQTEEIPADIEVVRIPDLVGTGRVETISKDRVNELLNFLHDMLKQNPEAYNIFCQLVQTKQGLADLLVFPSSSLSWAYDVIQFVESNLDLEQVQVVYTTSGPYSAHLIGLYLKQKYKIPWVADYRDPWSQITYSDLDDSNPCNRLLLLLESVLLHQADCNLVVEESLVQSYQDRFGLPADKLACITNGYDEADFENCECVSHTKKFTINYSGLIYTAPQAEGFQAVLKALRQLCAEKKVDSSKVQLRIVGVATENNLDEVKTHGLKEIVCYTGYLSHQDALKANTSADLLLLLVGDDEKLKPVYTGKIFEYLRSGRPILAVAPKDSAVDRVLQETGHGEAFLSTQVPKIKAMIRQEYQKWETGNLPERMHSPKIDRFERKALTGHLAKVLDRVANEPLPLPDTGSGDPPERITIPFMSSNSDSVEGSVSPAPHRELSSQAELFLQENYNYVWLKAMLRKARERSSPGATLITGSSYGVNGIVEDCWRWAVNCSVSSQDLYYDFLCAKKALSYGEKVRFSRCFIVDGYYAACHELSSGTRERESMIANVYQPIFKDAHNWKAAYENDLWAGFDELSKEEKCFCERMAIEAMLKQGTYFSDRKHRGGTVFDFAGQNWWELPEEQREASGKSRADSHNALYQHKESITENKRILKEYVHFLHLRGVMPIFVIAPFTDEYNRYLSKEMKESVTELVKSVPGEIRFVDFNQFSCFTPTDFVDTDHLSRTGAEKFSSLLVTLFGK